MLLQTPKLDADDLRVLGEIDRMRADLQLHVRTRPHWTGQLRRELFAAAVQGSNTIEQITVSMADARAAVEGQTLSADVDETTQQAILGYRDAMTFVQQTPHMANFVHHEMLLSALHYMIVKYNPDEYQYTITVDAGVICHTVRTNDTTMPALLRPLVDELSSLQTYAQ